MKRLVLVGMAAVLLSCGAALSQAQSATAVTQSSSASDSGLGNWELIPTRRIPTHRHECAYVKVGSRFYLIGGRGSNPIKPVEIFNPENRSWSTGAAPPIEMHHFQALEYDGKVYVIGALTGAFPKELPLPNVYIYDPVKDSWSKGPAVPQDRLRGAAGAVVYKDSIYLVNGIQLGHWSGHVAWFDVFNPHTGDWHQLADSPHVRDHFQAVMMNNKLYVAGGRRSSIATNQGLDLTVPEVDVFDFQTRKWSTLSPNSNLPTPRAGCTSVVVKERMLVIGGESVKHPQAHSEVEAFDPNTGQWTTLAPLIIGRHATQAVFYKDRVYVAAGSITQGGTETSEQEVFTIPAW